MKRKLSFLGVLTLFTFLVGCALFSGNTTTSNITAIPTNPFTTTTSATDGSVASSSDLMSTTTISMTDTTDLQTTTDTTNVLTTNNSDITTTSSERQYTIYFNENKGSEVPDISASAGEAVFEPSSPVREGHTFAGWYLDREYTNPYAFSIMPANNVVLWAKWEADLFTVTFYDADGDVYETQTVAYGQSAILPDDPIRESTEQYDYLFLGWIGNLDGIVKDEAIYPSYQKDLRWYTIVFYALDNVTILEHNSLTYGSTYQTPLLEVSTDDEIFAGWYSGINGSGEKLIESSPVKGDLVWYPHSIENPYLLEDRIAILHELSNQTGATSVDFSTWYNAILNSLGLTTESDEEVLLRLEDGMIRAYVETSGVSVDVIPLIDLLPGRSFAGIDLKIQNMAIGYEDTDGQWQQLMPLSVFHGQPGTSQMYFSADLTHFYWHTIEGREEIMIELASLLPEGYGELTLGYREGFAYLIDADEPREFLEFSMMKGPNFRTQSTMMVCPTYSDRCYITAYFTDGSNSSFTGIEVEFATVQVLDHFGEVISTEKIMLGQSKTMPLPYESEHMTFIGWSESTDVIWKDLVIRPLYQYDTYSLTLVDSLNGTTDILTDLQAEKEHVLPMPSRSGYVFLGWGNDDTSRENLVWPTVSLTEDRVMYAIYALESEYIHQVTFLDKDNKTVLAVVDVMEGKTPVAPTPPVYDGLVFSGWGYWQEAVYEDAIMVARYNSATAISKELLIYKFEKLMYNYEIPGKDEIWAIVTDGTEDLIGLTTIEFPQYIEGHRVYINGPRNYVFVDDKPEISNMYNSVDTVIFPAGVIIASGLEFANNVRKIVFLDGSETTYGNSIYYGVDTVIMEKLPMLFGADGVPDPSLLPFLHTYSVDNLVMHGRIAAPHEDSTATDFFDYYNFNTTDAGFRIFVEAEDLEYYRSLRYWSEIADHVYSMEMLTADFALSLYTDGEVTGWEIVGYLGNDTIVQIPAMIDDLPVVKIAEDVFDISTDRLFEFRNIESYNYLVRAISFTAIVMESSTPPLIDSNMFLFNDDGTRARYPYIIVPQAALANYQNAPVWSELSVFNYRGTDQQWLFTETDILDGYLVRHTSIDGVEGWELLADMNEDFNGTIPDSLGGEPVIALGDVSYVHRLGLSETLTIPASVIRVGEQTFAVNSHLKKVFFESGSMLKTIHPTTFYGCPIEYLMFNTSSLEPYGVNFGPNSRWRIVIPEVLAQSISSLPTTVSLVDSLGWTYRIEEVAGIFGAVVTGFVNEVQTLTIPDSLGGYPVLAIGSQAFESRSDIRNVVIADSVIEIRLRAFYQAYKLNQVWLGENTAYIGSYAFGYCDNLEFVDLANVVTIAEKAFYRVFLLELELPATLQSISWNAFGRIDHLVTHLHPTASLFLNSFFTSGCIEVVSGGVPSLWTDVLVSRVDTYQEGWLFPSIRATINISHATDLSLYNNTSSMLDGKVLIVPADIVDEIRAMYPKMIVYSLNSYANDLILDEISIDGVKGYRIREYLGSNSTFFVPAMINGLPVMEISGHFFYNSEIINYEVESGSQYFASYNGVLYSADYSTLITVPVYYPASSLATHPLTRKIGDSAFLYNLTIKHVILNEGLQEIGDYAFSAMPTSMDYIYGESQLESVVLPDTITTIGKEAFRMTKIRNWNWPDGLISIGEGAFSETIWNEPIVLPDNLKSIGNKAFFEAVFPEIFLNAGLIHIGSEAIWIKGELVIPSSVETFGSYAVSATKLIFLGQTPPEYHIDYNNPIIMIGDYTTFTIVVPESALEVYLQADDFIRYSDYIVPNIESDEVIVRIQLEPGRWTSMIKSNGSGLGVLSEPTRSGYAFAGWQLLVWKTDGSYEFVDLPTDLILDEDTIIVAVWEKDNSTLDIIETESFTFSMASIGYEHSLLFTPDQLHTDYELRLATDDFDVSPYGFPYIILYVYTTTGELVDQVNSTHGDNSNNMSTAYYDITLPDATQEYVFVFSGAKYNVDVLGTIMPVE